MITMTDCINLQVEYFRTHSHPSNRAAIALHLLSRSRKHLARRRTKAAKEARHILKLAVAEVITDEAREIRRTMDTFMGASSVSSRNFRCPVTATGLHLHQ